MRILLLICCLLFIRLSVFAQIIDTSRIQVDLSLTGALQEGNFERFQLINRFDVKIASADKKWDFQTRHLYLYQTVFGNKTQDDYLGRNFLTYHFNNRWDAFGAFFVETYWIKRIERHFQYGLGTRYSLLKSSRIFLQLGLMGSFSNKQYAAANFEDFDNKGSSTIDAFFITPVLDVRVVLIPRRLILKTLAWYQQDVELRQNWRYVIDGALLLPIWKGLNIRFSVNNFYEHINLEGVKANDLFLTYGVNYKFRK